jgi:hypothetical protein
MGHRHGSSQAAAEERPVCPSCGREAVGLVTGQCVYCLKPMAEGASRVDAGKILRLSEFERVRGQIRRTRGRKAARQARAGLVGLMVGAALVGLFVACLRWLEAFFGRGMAWKQ